MENSPLKQPLAELLAAAGEAHHQAFGVTGGEDPEWPIWYAGHLQHPLGRLLESDFTRSQIVFCLMTAELERQARAEEAPWAPFYADHLLDRFAPADAPAEERLALYHFPGCGFCRRVRAAIEPLGLDVELRDIHAEPAHWKALTAARGRATVPVLKIRSRDGRERWMPESADIIRYLQKTYG